jgi:hypothetical protein
VILDEYARRHENEQFEKLRANVSNVFFFPFYEGEYKLPPQIQLVTPSRNSRARPLISL